MPFARRTLPQMHAITTLLGICLLCLFALSGLARAFNIGSLQEDKWVWNDPDSGRLQYKRLPFPGGTVSQRYGDRIMDFSMVGYNASNSPCCPDIAATHPTLTVKPTGRPGDFAAIQAAIYNVSNMTLQGEFRGMVVLEKGIYSILNNEMISIEHSGVVLRGMPGTVLLATPPPGCCNNQGHPVCKDVDQPCYRTLPMIKIGVTTRPQLNTSTALHVKQLYVPSGAKELQLEAPRQALQGLVGKQVMVTKLARDRWSDAMRYAPPPGEPRAKQCTNRSDPGVWPYKCKPWPLDQPKDCRADTWLRRVTQVDVRDQFVVLDAPISDSINASLAYGWVVPYTGGYDVQHVGVEGIIGNYTLARCQQLVRNKTSKDYYKNCHAKNRFIETTANLEHAWVRDVTTIDATSGVGFSGRFLTALRAKALSTSAQWDKGAKPGVFGLSTSASHVLFDSYHCGIQNAFCMSTGSTLGPNVVRNSWGASPIQPHMRWATGLLLEGISGYPPEITNRCCLGSRHGWTAGYSVVWKGNYTGSLVLAKPPIGSNWVIGSNGTKIISGVGDGCVDKHIGEVQHVPSIQGSLFEAQLRERLSLNNIAIGHGVLPPSK